MGETKERKSGKSRKSCSPRGGCFAKYRGNGKQHGKRKGKRVRWFILLFCLLVVFAFVRRGYDLYAMDRQIEEWTVTLDTVMTEQDTLHAQKELLYDEDYIAILAREKLFFIYPGEKVWLLSTVNDHILTSVETEGIIAE